MGTKRLRPRLSADRQAPRLVAIRVIVDRADDDEVDDVVAEALLVLGELPPSTKPAADH